MFLKVTDASLGIYLLEVSDIFKIVEDATTLAVGVQLDGTKQVFPIDTLDALFNQQNVTGYNLGMILVTNTRTGNREIRFTKRIRMIVGEIGGGSKIITTRAKDNIVVTESLATILAYQGATKNLGIVSANVSLNGTNAQFLFMDHWIERITSQNPTTPGAAVIITKDTGSYPVTQTVAAIQAAMPT